MSKREERKHLSNQLRFLLLGFEGVSSGSCFAAALAFALAFAFEFALVFALGFTGSVLDFGMKGLARTKHRLRQYPQK